MVRSAILHERNKMKTKCRKGGEEIPAGKRTKKQSPELPVFAGVLSLSLSFPLIRCAAPLTLVWNTRMDTEMEKEG